MNRSNAQKSAHEKQWMALKGEAKNQTYITWVRYNVLVQMYKFI
jgi:hypothetical protein